MAPGDPRRGGRPSAASSSTASPSTTPCLTSSPPVPALGIWTGFTGLYTDLKEPLGENTTCVGSRGTRGRAGAGLPRGSPQLAGDRRGMELEGCLSPVHPRLIDTNLRCSPSPKPGAPGATTASQSSARRGSSRQRDKRGVTACELPIPALRLLLLLPRPRRIGKAGIWGSPTPRLLLTKALLSAKTKRAGKWKRLLLPRGHLSRCKGIFTGTWVVTDGKVTTEGFQAQHGAGLCRSLCPDPL